MAPVEGWDSAGFRERIGRTLADFVDSRREEAGQVGADALRLLDQAAGAVSGGKRFRAAFCWWGYQAVATTHDPAEEDALLRACAALELLHASALVHDDLIDSSDMRRGRPATHTAFAALHADRGWPSGTPAQYGAAAAILLGDLLLSWSDELLRTCGLPAERVFEALAAFDRARTEVALGQFLDVSVQARADADVDAAMKVVRYKSATYSVERPLHIGAALAGGGPDVRRALSAFGLPLGEAFQLRDDLLGVFGDPEATGKPAGDDLIEGKRTVLVALALEGLDPADALDLDRSLGTPMVPDRLDQLRALVERSGARERVESLIDRLTGDALRALTAAPVSDAARDVLAGLAEQATQRVG